MSHFVVTVLTPRAFALQEADAAVAFIRNLADSVKGNDFHVAGQPFNFEFVDLDDEIEEDLRGLVIQSWPVRGALRLVVFTSATVSHVLLGVMASRLAQMFDGWIALDGLLERVTDNPSVLTYEGINGRLRTEHGFDIVSPAVMGYWLGTESFRLP